MEESNRRSLHFATPDFLLSLMTPVSFMRLSLLKAAHVGVAESHEAGNPGTLRFGMTRGRGGDDKGRELTLPSECVSLSGPV